MTDEHADPQADELLQRVHRFIRDARALDDQLQAIARLVKTMSGQPFAAAAFVVALMAERHDETLDALLNRLHSPIPIRIVFNRKESKMKEKHANAARLTAGARK